MMAPYAYGAWPEAAPLTGTSSVLRGSASLMNGDCLVLPGTAPHPACGA